mmetsp:Transcript_33209/g.50088  ORF Transcript_33209/g.50088 Transcript_33209/m.50088 type:complete len:306 (+) Transcript_33209:165-1082(+)|eukprot:CAMPEP_0178915240 /NCGR_PEP_ID=MMETSP0786-20121207/11909_1 /TAXON_ID=186022 /ORGANISM="Thalassionema frauenfeldii, Strain CCMP 1798" /LENGTH=305 /DNA_ID=CAMNT_0020588313 /DNA_START=82 /DNA_END=999 /DNA_ORIENTATION=+
MSSVLQKSLLQGLRNTRNPSRRYLSSSFAAIDHSKEYEEAMEGRHGKQLKLAKLDGLGKDDPLFDPFPELERQLQINLSGGGEAIDEGDDFFADNIQEAAYKEKDESKEEFLDESEEEVDDEIEEDDTDDGDEENYYRNDGSVPYSKAQLAEFKAGAPAGGLFAIIQLNGTQHKVTVDDVIVNHILKPISKYPIGSIVELRDDGILLMGSTHQTLVGMPFVSGGAVVKLMVEEITLDAKVIIFKKRRRKNSQRRNGFRRQVMMLRVLDIQFPPEFALDNHVPRVEPKTDLKRPPSLLEDMKEEYA